MSFVWRLSLFSGCPLSEASNIINNYLSAFLDSPVAGISNWYRPHPVADGDSITLYEHKPGNTQHHGDPIADVFSIVVRSNNCILAVADGVNWGIKPRLAARCAVHGVMEYLNVDLYSKSTRPKNVQDVFHSILRAFHCGQKKIIKCGGTTTTLCVAVVVELQEPRGGAGWGLCVVSVGDTLCYVWREEVQMVYEVTMAMHLGKERNPRDCGGCLGCDLGDQPDLSNLLCCFVPIASEDVVFIVSDGISDNSDPVILKEALAEGQPLSPTSDPSNQAASMGGRHGSPPGSNGSSIPTLPVVTPEQRQALILMKLTTILKHKTRMPLQAQDVRDAVINYVIEATEVKREYLEKRWVELERPDISIAERRANERDIAQHIKFMPGKLDHATIAAYKVGKLKKTVNYRDLPTHSHGMRKEGDPGAEGDQATPFHGGSKAYGVIASDLKSRNQRVAYIPNQKIKMSRTRLRVGESSLKKSSSFDDGLQSHRPRSQPLERSATVDDGLQPGSQSLERSATVEWYVHDQDGELEKTVEWYDHDQDGEVLAVDRNKDIL